MLTHDRTPTRRAILLALLALPLLVTGCKDKTPPPPTKPARVAGQAPDTFRVSVETSKGTFAIEVNRAWSPLGAERFYKLVTDNYFNDVRFFRVLPGFMAQFGISGDPAQTKKWQDATISDEPVLQSNKRGMVTFAKTMAPNTRSNQFFINFADNAMLDPQGFSPIGQVVEGMNVVDALYGGYGEGAPNGPGPDQMRAVAEGNAYLTKAFPKLDYIKTTKIVSESPHAP